MLIRPSGLALFFALATATTSTAVNRVGDADNNKSQDMADAVLVQSALYGTAPASTVSPMALSGGDLVLGVDDLMRTAQIANAAATDVAPPSSLLALTAPAGATHASSTNPVKNFTVASASASATMVDGLDALSFDITQGAAVQSTLSGAATAVASGAASVTLVAYNPAAPNDTVTIRMTLPVQPSTGASSTDYTADSVNTVTPPVCGDFVVQPPEQCDSPYVPTQDWTLPMNYVQRLDRQGDFIYVADIYDFKIFDVSGPAPVFKSMVGYYCTDASVQGYRGFASMFGGGFWTIDVTGANAVKLGSHHQSSPPGLERVHTVSGNRAYVYLEAAGGPAMLATYNISGNVPVLLSIYDLPAGYGISHMKAVGTKLYIVTGSSGRFMGFDVTNNMPVLLFSYAPGGWAEGLDIVGNFAYVGTASGPGLVKLNISGPTPTLVWSTPVFTAYDVDVAGNRAYVAAGNTGISIYDIGGASPISRGTIPVTASHMREVHVENGKLYGVQFYNALRQFSLIESCNTNCTQPVCGNGVVDAGEVCDSGANNGTCGNCDATCSGLFNTCGDGVVQCGETCDSGYSNGLCGSCSFTCANVLVAGACGDGVVNCGEVCDEGDTDPCGQCNATCSGPGSTPVCGDGVVCPSVEACDDGRTTDCGPCNATCTAPGSGSVCGDSVICPDTETCDDGDAAACAGPCDSSCTALYCGDGQVNCGEPCDLSADLYPDPAPPAQSLVVQGTPPPLPDVDPSTPVVSPEVEAALSSGERARVIVTLSQDEGIRRAATVADQHAAIFRAEQRVLNHMRPDEFKAHARMVSFPMFTGEVTRGGLQRLRNHPHVRAIELDSREQATLDVSVPLVNADDAHTLLGRYGTGVGVAVLDTGIDPAHPALAPRLIHEECRCWNDVPCCPNATDTQSGPGSAAEGNGHGTHMAGIVASVDATYGGMAPRANLIAVKVLDSSGAGHVANIMQGIDWCVANRATYNIRVINMSLGSQQYFDQASCDAGLPAYTTAIAAARAAGIAVVVSSGNDGWTDSMTRPGCISSAISVGAVYSADFGAQSWTGCNDATTAADQVTCFSNSASFMDLLAPGALITSTTVGGGFGAGGGTSMAAPHVAGLAAMMFGANGALTVDDIEGVMKASGVPVTDTRGGCTTCPVFPRIDAYAAVSMVDTGNEQCLANCTKTCDPGYTWSGSDCLSTCGDGIWVDGETCDDGNLTNGDGCNDTCTGP